MKVKGIIHTEIYHRKNIKKRCVCVCVCELLVVRERKMILVYASNIYVRVERRVGILLASGTPRAPIIIRKKVLKHLKYIYLKKIISY